ncbi:hypothetical protein NHX12_015080 [Muraenolepis orangiensis]|uniref:Uncharacterized protein n=1 Tax=Muraenolepis orangiensis TaxID=630683 RepID=A0A9Q0DCP2_9TELE|nr:hypothetical protein NHX12_015080 [Muraenolepis orangiensis]
MVGKTHTAKQLGPMIQKCLAMAEWVTTESPLLQRSPDGQYWRICHKSREEGVIERVERERSTMATTDHPGMKEVYERIDKFDLWAKGDYDVGKTLQHCIQVPLKDTGHSVWQTQYWLKPDAVEGIRPTIAGLLQAGVLCYSDSSWNTPILPLPKAGPEGSPTKWRSGECILLSTTASRKPRHVLIYI